ncbi:unnamed protein product, partial [Prorocentrum cordatum]
MPRTVGAVRAAGRGLAELSPSFDLRPWEAVPDVTRLSAGDTGQADPGRERTSIMTRSGSTGMLVRPKAADATDFKREHTMLRSSSIAGGLAAQIKSAVAGADPLAQAPGVRRPLSRTTISRRRPAPK